MRQVLMLRSFRWILIAPLLAQIAMCNSIPIVQFNASECAGQSNIFGVPVWTTPPRQSPLWSSVFVNNSYGSAGSKLKVNSGKSLVFFPLDYHDYHTNYSFIGAQRANTGTTTLWRFLKTLVGPNSGPCERAWTTECEHSFGNKSYRPAPEKK
jgi:hypothetical protein